MKNPRYIIMALACVIFGVFSTARCEAAAIGNATYGLYSETYDGIDYSDDATVEIGYMGTWKWPPEAGIGSFPTLSADTSTFTEGGQSLKVVSPSNASGMYIWFGNLSIGKIATDMRAYNGGSMEFDIRSNVDIEIKIEWGASSAIRYLSDYVSLNGSKWQHVSIPLSHFSGIDLSAITVPAVISALGSTQKTFYIDNIVWRKATGGSFDVTLRKVSDNSIYTGSGMTWSNIQLGSTRWKAADQYVELKMTQYSPEYREKMTAWPYGVQIYTDNKDVSASPRYTGTGDPAGLIDVSTTTRTPLPMCWRIVDQSTTTHIMQGAPGAPGRLWESALNNEYPCYIWMRDKASADFSNGTDYVTAWDYRGIQHGEMTFGGAKSPNYVYIGADFSSAIGAASGSRVYRTGKLIVELYNE